MSHAINSARPALQHSIVCDDSNNTLQDEAEGKLNVDVFVTAAAAADYCDPAAKSCIKSDALLYTDDVKAAGGGCHFAGPGRGDCDHFIGYPSNIHVPQQHDGPDDTVDCYGKPNGWCWYCWLQYQLAAAQSELWQVKEERALLQDPEHLLKVLERLRNELQTERLRLAACGVAAIGYFDGCSAIYNSASLDDVIKLRRDWELCYRAACADPDLKLKTEKRIENLERYLNERRANWATCLHSAISMYLRTGALSDTIATITDPVDIAMFLRLCGLPYEHLPPEKIDTNWSAKL
jgi:hypothetical protein